MHYRIPWPEGAAWRQSIAIDGRVYKLSARWNEVGEFWAMNIDLRDGTPLVHGVKITTGALLTARHADNRLPPGYFIVLTSSDCGCTPGRDDMKKSARLIYVSPV